MLKNLIIGLDVGGTKIHAGLVTRQGKILKRAKILTQASKGRAAILKNIEAAVRGVWHKDVVAIGVGLAGSVDHKRGIFLQGPNLSRSFRSVPIAALLKKRFKVPVSADNDVHCFALGEARFGAGKRRASVVGITLGTGIGGGIVMDGKLYRGKGNTAGEVGHMVIAKNGDDFERLASGTAMSRMYKEKTGKRVDALTVEKLALKGDRAAKEVLATMREALAVSIANLLDVLDPDIIVIGGGISRVKALWPRLARSVGSRVVYPALAKTPVVRAKLGDDANILGAALLTERRKR
jgi:glucokinase